MIAFQTICHEKPQGAALAWSATVEEAPAGPPLVAGEWLLLPTRESAPAPAWSRLHWLGLADGRPGQPLDLKGALVSGLAITSRQTSEVFQTSEVWVLVTTYSAEAMGDQGALLALDAAGEARWRWSPGVHGISAPTLAKGKAWVTTNTGLLVALDLATGEEQARFALGATPTLSTPALVGDAAYIPCRGPRLLAVRLDGERRWEFEATDHPQGWLNHTPVVVGEHLVAVLNRVGRVIALRLPDGEPAWQVQVAPAGKDLSPPVTDGERLYVGTREGLHTLDAADGHELWRFPIKRGLEASPAVVGGVVYIACRDHYLYALDSISGQELWRYGVERRIEVPPLITAGPRPLAVIADRGGAITALQRPLSAAEHEAAGDWTAAAATYAALGQLTRAAELLEAHGESFKAAQLWQATDDLERAAGQYELAGAWPEAADLWRQLDRSLKQAQALEQHARSLVKEAASDEVRADAWANAAEAFEAAGDDERAEACRREVARCRHLPYLAVDVKHENLVLNAWTRLRFIVHNQGSGAARQLIIRAGGGQFEGQVAETRQIMTLRVGQTREDWLDIRPLAYGDSVPLRVSIEYQDRTQTSQTWWKTLYLPVAQTQVAQEKPTEPPRPDDSLISGHPTTRGSYEQSQEAEKKDFFVSYNRADRTWAEWIAWHLEEAGYTTFIQAWDFRPGGNFVIDMQRATEQARRTIAILSPDYLQALYTQPEWAAAFAQDPTGEKGTLLPVRVRECELKGLLPQIVYIDLVGLDKQAAKKELLAGVKQGRAKPTIAPSFPGAVKHTTSERPDFPGEASSD